MFSDKCYLTKNLIILQLLKLFLIEDVNGLNYTMYSDSSISEKHSEILSRRKRFLIFPEGSSLQLVFCLTYPTIFEIGEIFLLGNTAALAWELPQDPYSPYRHRADPLHRRVDLKDNKNIYYTDYDGRVLFKRPYQRKAIVNPAFAKRSILEPSKSDPSSVNVGKIKKGNGRKLEIDQRRMHAAQRKRDFLKMEHMSERNVQFHRSSRVSLYEKLETMYKALGSEGRQCMLKTLCKTGQIQDTPQGSFMEELMRAIFT